MAGNPPDLLVPGWGGGYIETYPTHPGLAPPAPTTPTHATLFSPDLAPTLLDPDICSSANGHPMLFIGK